MNELEQLRKEVNELRERVAIFENALKQESSMSMSAMVGQPGYYGGRTDAPKDVVVVQNKSSSRESEQIAQLMSGYANDFSQAIEPFPVRFKDD